MTSTYKQLLEQRKALESQILEARKAELGEAISKVRTIVAEFELQPNDVFGTPRAASSIKGSKVAAKYRDPATGATWTGRGKPPVWIANQDRNQFLIETQQ